MKIRITKLPKLPKAQVGMASTPIYSVNGRQLDPNNPADAQEIANAKAASDAANAHFAQPSSIDMSQFKAPMVGPVYQDPEPESPSDPYGNIARPKAQGQLVNPSTNPGLLNQVNQMSDNVGYEMDQRYQTDPKFKRRLDRSTRPANINTSNNVSNAISNLQNFGQDLQKGIGVTSALTDMFVTNPQRQRDNQARVRSAMQTDNLFPLVPGNMSGNKGDYVAAGSRYGDFRPDEKVANKGMYSSSFYPEMRAFQLGGGLDYMMPSTVLPSYTPSSTALPVRSAAPSNTPSTRSYSNNTSNAHSSNNSGSFPSHYDHNNPGNIHIGGFAKQYGATQGRPDGDGYVAVFPDMQTGIKAMKDLLFGSAYSNLPISAARTKWVGYDNPSSRAIANAVGSDKKLSDLSPEEREKVFNEFIRWEDANVYNQMKKQGLAYQQGGQTNNMKIRITGAPEAAYGGQFGFGIDLGQRGTYDTITKNSYEHVSDTIPEAKNGGATIEAEKGETVVYNKDGVLVHQKIGGKRHFAGGTPLAVPQGSFIFSDTKKMKIKNPAILAHFNKTYKAGGITPADVAKQYDINKYQAIIDDPQADDLSKNTAKLMLSNYKKKLGGLALVQESMKGFPQGVPELAKSTFGPQKPTEDNDTQAKYGGYFADGGESGDPVTDEMKKAAKRAQTKKDLEGYTKVADADGRVYYQKKTKVKDAQHVPGSDTPGHYEKGYNVDLTVRDNGVSPDDIMNNPDKYKTFHKLLEGAPEDIKRKAAEDLYYHGHMPGKYVPGEKTPDQDIPEEWKTDYLYEEPEQPTTPGGGGGDNNTRTIPTKFNQGRKPFFGHNLFVAPQRDVNYAAPMNAMMPEPTFYDPSRELASNEEQSNAMLAYMSGLGSPQSYAANASAVQGNALRNAADINGRYNNLNVGVANQFSPLQTNIMNQLMQYQANRADTLAWNQNQMNKSYNNSLRNYLGSVDKYRANDYDYYTKRNITNAVNPYFNYVDGPGGGNIQFKPGVDQYSMITGRFNMPGMQQQQGLSGDQYLATMQNLRSKYKDLSPGQLNKAIGLMYPGMGGSANNRAMMAQYMSQAMNNPYNASNPIYRGGYDINSPFDTGEE